MVKEGYKETQIGILPQSWKVTTLEEEYFLFAGGDLDLDDFSELPNGKYKYEIYSNALQNRGIYGYCSNPRYDGNAITITGRGDIGHCFYRKEAFSAIVRLLVCQPKGEISSLFVAEYLEMVQPFVFESTGVPQLTVPQINRIKIPLPDIQEQNKIAEVLSDTDNLISSLEKLIEKKKAIKQGVMQELLTGKRRLAGFNGKWAKMNLAKKSKIKARIGWQGLTTAEYLDSGYSYLVTGTDFKNGFIDWDGCHYVEKNRYDQDKNIQIQNEDILITKDGSLGKVAYISGLSKPATLNSGVFVIRPIQNSYDTRFVYYVLSSFVFKDFLQQLSAGSTIIHLYQKDMNKFEFYIPDDIKEQKAIADILFDMDAEITALEQKLAKCQKLKQGMMQQLLTGKIRLVPNDDEVTDKPEVETLKVSTKGHNHQFDDAVVIAGIVDKFYSDKYYLGRKKVQKLLYLFRRHQEADTSAFKKKAAGPYADEVRYKGGEPIAISSKYISVKKGAKGSSFSKGEKIADALTYLENWNLDEDLKWLCEQFKYTKTDKLELLATVDMAICDLGDAGITVTVNSIKNLIKSHPEWKAKLSKSYFKDNDIAWAIKECKRLFERG